MDFSEQYKHPLWQKKRLEAMEHAGFQCQSCYDEENQLHVHHKRYFKGRMIWEYDLEDLEVLCNGCHEVAHEEKDQLSYLLSRIDSAGLRELIGLISGYCRSIDGPLRIDQFDAYKYVKIDNEKYYILGSIAAALSLTGMSSEQVGDVFERICTAMENKASEVAIKLEC